MSTQLFLNNTCQHLSIFIFLNPQNKLWKTYNCFPIVASFLFKIPHFMRVGNLILVISPRVASIQRHLRCALASGGEEPSAVVCHEATWFLPVLGVQSMQSSYSLSWFPSSHLPAFWDTSMPLLGAWELDDTPTPLWDVGNFVTRSWTLLFRSILLRHLFGFGAMPAG